MLQVETNDINQQVTAHLNKLCVEIGPRPSGSPGNQAAAEYIRQIFAQCNLEVEMQYFDCPSWDHGGTLLELDGIRLDAAANAYSPPCDVTAPTVAFGTLSELESVDLEGRIVVLYGDLVKSPIACKSWFLKSEQDESLVHLLESKKPVALLTIQAGHGELERLIEDWEFHIPSATVPARAGLAIMDKLGSPVHLKIDTSQSPGSTCNVVARKPGTRPERLVFIAHYDTKIDTPGAVDNASGVATLLALAQTLSQRELSLGMEWIAFTNEEYLPLGDDEYMRRYGDSLGDIELAINFDGVSQRLSVNSIAIYTNSQPFHKRVIELTNKFPGVVWVDPWPESNHSSFAWRGVPCLAFTSRGRAHIAHLRTDTIDQVDPARVEELVALVSEITESIQDAPKGWTRPPQTAE